MTPCFQHQNFHAGLGEHIGRHAACRARSNDHDVGFEILVSLHAMLRHNYSATAGTLLSPSFPRRSANQTIAKAKNNTTGMSATAWNEVFAA